jgi:quercetin dioxygenase-like cupin family protein
MYNRSTGERYTLLKTALETGGTLLLLDVALPPGGEVPSHVHRGQEKRFEVLAGTGCCRVGEVVRLLSRGVAVVVPPGTAHSLWSDGEDELLLRAEFRPALDLAERLEAACAPDRQ